MHDTGLILVTACAAVAVFAAGLFTGVWIESRNKRRGSAFPLWTTPVPDEEKLEPNEGSKL